MIWMLLEIIMPYCMCKKFIAPELSDQKRSYKFNKEPVASFNVSILPIMKMRRAMAPRKKRFLGVRANL